MERTVQLLDRLFGARQRTVPKLPNVFAAIDRGVLVEDPYPHLVVEDALPAPLIDALLNEMPPAEVFTRDQPGGSNVRFALPSSVALADPRPSAAWKAAIRECNASMGGLLAGVMRRLGDHVLRTYPDFATRYAPPGKLRAVPREQGTWRPHEVGMDAQMVINTPALSGGTSVRGPHLDIPDKLISALLYLRAPDDDSTGGELELYAAKRPGITFDERNDTAWENVEFVRRYPYRHNLLILPLCGPNALHGVSARSATNKPRYHLHLVGQMATPLFAIPH
jgi:hypothetical protein